MNNTLTKAKFREVILETIGCFSDAERHIIGVGTADKNGQKTSLGSPDTVKWCLMGKVGDICYRDQLDYNDVFFLLRRLSGCSESDSLIKVNDIGGREKVLELLNKVLTNIDKEEINGH